MVARAYDLGESGSHAIVLGSWGEAAWLVFRPLKLSDHSGDRRQDLIGAHTPKVVALMAQSTWPGG